MKCYRFKINFLIKHIHLDLNDIEFLKIKNIIQKIILTFLNKNVGRGKCSKLH